MIFYQLSRPVSYLSIEDQSKWKIDWLLPFALAIAINFGYLVLPDRPDFYGEDGLMQEFQGFLEILPGFFLAALAAIATFNKEDLDRLLPEPTPKIGIRIKNKSLTIGLTRRRMLSYLFGYLTFLSVFLCLAVVIGSAVQQSYYHLFGHSVSVKIAFFFIFNLFFWQMIIVTIFGLYQLCDRIHQPDDET